MSLDFLPHDSAPRPATVPMPWVPALDPIAPLAVMDWRLDCLAAEAMGPEADGPDGRREGLLPLCGGEVVGAGGLAGRVVPGPAALMLRRPDGLARLSFTVRLALSDGNSVIAAVEAMGEGAGCRAVLRCVVNRGPHDWLNQCLLMATVSHVTAASSVPGGGATSLWLRVYAMEGQLGPGVVAGYVPLREFPLVPPLRTEHLFNIVGTCSAPSPAGLSPHAPDGLRTEIWPITGGSVASADGRLTGQVVAGGGDYPHLRPDGVEWVEALYRFRTDDGYNIVIHNKGIYREGASRLQPEFIVNRGPHDWLNRSLFVATLTFPVPPELNQTRRDGENDRLIQVHRVA